MSSLNGERLRSEGEGGMGFDVLHGVSLGWGQHAFNILCLYTSFLTAEIHFRSYFAKVSSFGQECGSLQCLEV